MGFGVINMEVSQDTQRMCSEWREVHRSLKIRSGQKREPRVNIGKGNINIRKTKNMSFLKKPQQERISREACLGR